MKIYIFRGKSATGKTTLTNQYFKSIDEIVEHYNRCDMKPLNDEVVLDSVLEVTELLEKILEVII